MKVTFLTCLAGVEFVYNAGDQAEIEAGEAKRLIDAGIAEPASAAKEKKVKKAKATSKVEAAVKG